MAAKKEKVKEEIVIPPIDIRYTTVHIVGDTPLIIHKWSEKAKKEILDKQMKKAKAKAHDAKDPFSDFINSLYWLDGEPDEHTPEAFAESIRNGARFGFPSVAFKECAVTGGYRDGITQNKVSMYAAFHIDGEFVEIHGIPEMREDMVRVGGVSKVSDIRYRGMFKEWSATFPVKYNAAVISEEQIINLFMHGGFACGLGEWRVEKGGSFGMFHVE